MTTTSVCHKDFQKYPYHYCLTLADLRLGLCSQKNDSYWRYGWVNHRKKTLYLAMMHQNHHCIQGRYNLSIRALSDARSQSQHKIQQKVWKFVKSIRCNRKIKDCSCWEISQNPRRLTQLLINQRIRLQLMQNECAFVDQGTVRPLSQLFCILCCFLSCQHLLFIHCSSIFSLFHCFGGNYGSKSYKIIY